MSMKEIHLFVSFLPYARQDRLEPDWIGQSFALKVFAELINAQQYASVRIFDPHSSVATAVIDRSVAAPGDAFLREVFRDKNSFVLVSPDAGAAKKIRHASAAIGYTEKPVQALKYRLVGGTIDQVEIFEKDIGGKDVYIIDDICDGGATFIALASELRKRNVGKVILVVSHGIFSRGTQALLDAGIDHIYTTDSFKDQVPSDRLTEVKLCNILT
jgi:ribose-phosphate pyrophosphokinase